MDVLSTVLGMVEIEFERTVKANTSIGVSYLVRLIIKEAPSYMIMMAELQGFIDTILENNMRKEYFLKAS